MNCSFPAAGARALRTALTVTNVRPEPVLSPFFGKSDGLLVLDAARGSREFHHNGHRTAESLSELIVTVKPERLICSYIGTPEKERLQAAGIDIRLGSCACPIDELWAGFHDLPVA